MTTSLKIAEEIWRSLERVRGSYHQNDKDAYVAAVAKALNKKDETIRILRLELGERHTRIKALKKALKFYAEDPLSSFAQEALAQDDKHEDA